MLALEYDSTKNIESTLLHKTLKKWGWSFGDLAPLMTDFNGQVLEIFTPDGTQLYRNLEYFKSCGYSLDELFTYSYSQLYSYSKNYLQEYFTHFARALDGERVFLKGKDKKAYILKECSTGNSVVVIPEAFWPLFCKTTKKVVGVFVVSRRYLYSSQDISFTQRPSITRKNKKKDSWLVKGLVTNGVYDVLKGVDLGKVAEWLHKWGVFYEPSAEQTPRQLPSKTFNDKVQELIRFYTNPLKPFAAPFSSPLTLGWSP